MAQLEAVIRKDVATLHVSMQSLVLKVKVQKAMRLRTWLSTSMMRLAALILGSQIEIEVAVADQASDVQAAAPSVEG